MACLTLVPRHNRFRQYRKYITLKFGLMHSCIITSEKHLGRKDSCFNHCRTELISRTINVWICILGINFRYRYDARGRDQFILPNCSSRRINFNCRDTEIILMVCKIANYASEVYIHPYICLNVVCFNMTVHVGGVIMLLCYWCISFQMCLLKHFKQ